MSAQASGTSCHAPPPRTEAGPDDSRLTIALLGRPNSGKSSLYNALTGGNARVGNYPGITVDILEAKVTLPDGREATVADLPGLYSIDAVVDRETDEGIARAFLDRHAKCAEPLVLVQVIDGTQLALGLRLTRELLRRPSPLLVVVTQRDVLDAEGRTLDARELERELGVPVLAVSAREPHTKQVVLDAVAALARGPIDAAIGARRAPEWDPGELAQRVVQDAPRADEGILRRRTFTARADAILLHPVVGPVLFLAIMSAIFAAVFLVADPATQVLDAIVSAARAHVAPLLGGGMLASFVCDGVMGGAGTVLAFMPQIVILTVAMELLEASGYLSRGAFLLDRLLRVLGLSGHSFMPLLMGHACAVPAISATRTIRDPRERLTTILVLPLMTCSARIPTYGLLIGTFFASQGAWVQGAMFVGLYFAGILAGLVASLVLRRTAARGRSLPLVMEMPRYRMPQARVVARTAARTAKRFLRDVGSTILVASAALWVLLTVPLPGARAPEPPDQSAEVSPMENSIAAGVGRSLEPITRPVGFDWRINVGLIGSFGARELMVGTMGVIFGVDGADEDPAPLSERLREATKPDGTPAYTTRTALALLAFFVLACQCMSTVAAIWRETKSWRWPAFVIGYTYALGYAAAFAVYHGAGLLGL